MTKDAARATDAGYDFSALTRPITWAEVTAARPSIWRDMAAGIAAIVVGLAYGWWWFMGPRPQLPDDWSFVSTLGDVVSGILCVVMLFVVVIGFVFAASPLTERRDLRIRLFAAENDFRYLAFGNSPPRVGVVFGEEGGVAVKDQLIDPHPRTVRSRTGTTTVRVSLGNADLSTAAPTGPGAPKRAESSRRSQGTVGYLHVELSAASTHYLLDGKANNSFGVGRGEGLQTNQQLSLEGDFNEYFTLYCPPGAERDALQIFTPDVMALLIDHGATWDVEIVDDNLFVYLNRPLHPRRAEEIARLLTFADLVVPKLGGRIERSWPSARQARETIAQGRPGRLRSLVPKRRGPVIWPFVVLLGILAFGFGLNWLLDVI